MRSPLPLRQLWCCLVGSTALLTLAGSSPAEAQARSAAIRVSADVRSVTQADILGAHVLATLEQGGEEGGAALGSRAWRIMPGRASSVELEVDAPAGAGSVASLVTICDDGDHQLQHCAPYRAPRIETRGEGAAPAFVVLVGKSQGTVRVTLWLMDF